MKDKKKPILIAVIVVAALGILAACIWFFWLRDYLTAKNAAPAYVNSVAVIAGMDSGNNPRYSGIVEPQSTFKVNKDESKTVAEVLVSVGDEVHIGDPLFRYDTEEMQLALEQAELEQEGIANQISTLRAQKKTLESEKKKASKDDQYSYTVQIQSVELQIRTEEYNSSVKKSEVEKLKNSLENAEVLSEAEGVIKEINLTPKTDSTGQPLPFISILSSGEFRVKGTISELNLSSLSEGQAVVVHSRVNAEQTWKGTVETIDLEPAENQNGSMSYVYGYGMDSGQKSSQYNFYVVLENLEGLILGQHVYIEPDLGETTDRSGLWLPASYVDHDDAGSFVWAKSDKDRLEKRAVLLGEYDDSRDLYEIINGVTTTDYIAYPSDTLQEGAKTIVDASVQPVMDGAGEGNVSALEGEPPFPEDGAFDPMVGGSVEDGQDLPAESESGEAEADFDYADDGESTGMEGLAR